jgi:drug/metabolite transporter (DMT)-like permease
MTSNPIMVLVISAFLLRSSISVTKIIGVVIGAIGAVSLLVLSNQTDSTGLHFQGDIFILINSLSYAFYLVLVKPLMSKYHPMLVIAWVFTIGFIAVLPFGGSSLTEVNWSVLTTWQWFTVFYVIIFVTFLTYLFNIIALSILTPTIASAYIYLQPLLAGVFSFLFSFYLTQDYSGDITLPKVICTLLIFLGIYLTSRAR